MIVVADPSVSARINNDAVPPVMSYFEPKKTTTSGASFILNQRRRWAELMQSADVVAIVGVKVRPTDDHIWKPIGESAATLVYCAGPRAATEFRSWAVAARPKKDDVALDGYFTDEFDRICQEIALG